VRKIIPVNAESISSLQYPKLALKFYGFFPWTKAYKDKDSTNK